VAFLRIMRLTHLSLTDFRNFTRLDVPVPPGAVLVTGDNAQGKTSLLEAVYYLATFTSFHADSDRQLVNFLAGRAALAVGRIIGEFERDGARHRIEVRLIQEATMANGLNLRKEILVDGAKRKVSEAMGQFNAVLFLPQSCRVIEGAPEERRRYLNLALAQVISFYPAALADYNRALTQRNALLKLLNERGGDLAQLDFWDRQLAEAGAQLIHARIRAVQEMEHSAARAHRDLTHGAEILRFSYQPAYDPLPRAVAQMALPLDAPVDRSAFGLEQIGQGFLERLGQLRREEIARGVTTIGPHRDELRFLSNGIDLGTYGSRGQVRTAILSLKLAEMAWMHERSGHWPVLLLDEVLAELDVHRRTDLLARLAECQQSLLTTTDLDLFNADFVQKAARWHVQGGRVDQVTNQA
jgi:DNA replication and repair protein RecF